jgi:phosphatidylglycerophosphatase A
MQREDVIESDAPGLSGRLAVWLASGLGLGLVTPAPGTVAGLWGAGLAAAVAQIPSVSEQIGLTVVLVLLAVPICGSAARALGTRHDPGAVVLDEIVALPIVFMGVVPFGWAVLAAGYVLFRLCDICKPGLARAAEKLPGGWGIVADDVLAAVLACILLHAAVWVDSSMNWHWLTPAAAG